MLFETPPAIFLISITQTPVGWPFLSRSGNIDMGFSSKRGPAAHYIPRKNILKGGIYYEQSN
jgi:hypothetical protein